MSSDLHGVGIKLKTTQPISFHNSINMWIMLQFSTEDGHFQALCTLFLAFLSNGNYRFNYLCYLNPMMDKVYACKRLSRKYMSIQRFMKFLELYTVAPTVHWEYNTSCISVVEAKRVTTRVDTLKITSIFYKNNTNLFFVPKYEKCSVITADIFTKTYSGLIISRNTKWMTGFRFYPTSDTEHYQLMKLNEFFVK